MSSSSSLYLRQLIVALTWFGLLALACTGGSSLEEGGDEESEFRGGDPPAGLDVAVDTLRGNGITLAASTPVGTIAGGGSVSATGQAGYTVPLDVPPGAGGLAPSLSLSYSSGAGNGLFGIGWGLTGFSSIDRCGKTIADDGAFSPVELDGDDGLCFGGQRLVLVAGTHLQPGAEYRTKRDPFSRITTRSYQGALVYFDVESPDGLISTYGYTEVLSSGGVRYSWLLETIRDRHANTVAYDYVTDGGSPSLRPSSVSWNGGRVALVADPAGRDDERRGFRFGVPHAQLDRIAAIEVFGADDALLHTYELEYEYVAQWAFGEQEPEPWAPHTRSTLQRVSKCDAAGVCMPPTTFQYSGSGTALDVPSENLPGMPEGVEHLSQEQQEVLRWGKRSLAGDFNGDLDYELIVWEPQAEAFEVVAPGSTIGVADVAGLDPPSALPPSWEDVAYWLEAGIRSIAQDPYAHELQASEVGPLHRVQPAMGYLVVNFDNDRRDDILYAVGGGYDLDDVGYADSLRIATQGSDYEDPENDDTLSFTTVNVDDFSAERIYNVVPLDHDGNGLTDLWLCRGNGGFKSARWVLALNEGDSGTFQFSFHNSNVGCSIHDELNVMSLRGARQSLLVIPAYEWDPDEILERDDPEVADYVDDVLPIDENLRLFYLELQFEPGSAEDGELVDSGLPRDLFQRWRDRDCQNSLADADIGLPLFSVGMSRDRHVDLNGDGYVDILRAELANDPVGFPGGSDTQHNIIAIKTGFGPGVGYGLGVTCDAIPSQPLVLRGWINTGTGFVRGDRFYTFPGNPHANYWVNIQGGQLTDRDRDGYADLLVPGTGASNNWTYLMGSGQAIGCPGGTCATTTSVGLPSGWPSYSTAIASNLLWRNSVERASLLQLRAIGGIAFEGAVDDEPDPIRTIEILPYETYHNNGLRLWRVTSGLGYFAAGAFGAASEEFYYGCAGLPSLVTESGIPGQANRPKTTPRACVPVVTRHFVRVRGEEPGDGAYTDYDYSGAVIDQHGRGFVGFEQVQSQYSNDYFTYDTTLSDYDLTYNATLRDYPYAGIPVRTRVARHFGTTGQMLDVRCSDRDVGEWDVVTIPRIGGLTWFSYPTETRTYGQAVSSSSSENGCDDLTPDQESFATEQRNPDGTVTLVGSSTTDGEQVTMTPSNFVNDTTNWFIGKPQRIDVQSCVDGVCRTRSTALSYQPLTHALTGITREPDQVGTALFLHTQFHYGVAGRLHDVFVNDAFGETRQTTIDWDWDGRLPLLVINPEGHTTYLVHDESSGVQWATVAPDGITTITEFDGFYRPVEQRVHDMPLGPSDGRVEIEYLLGAEPSFGAADAVMRVRTSQYPYGQRVTAEIDAAGREVRRRWKAAADTTTFPIPLPAQTSFYGNDVYVDTRYDEFGRANRTSHPTLIPNPPSQWTHVDRDAFGRPIREAIATGPEPAATASVVETWNYIHGGGIDGHDVSLESQHTDADGRTTTSFIDLNGRVAVTRDALNTLTCFDYAPFGVLESVQRNCASGASGPSTTTTYVPDAIGRIVGENDPAFGTATTSYTAFGEVDVTVDAAGIVIDTDYDKLGRPIARDENGQGTATWDWDTNRLGQLYESVSVDGFSRRYIYGPFRRLQERRTVGPTTPGGTAPKRASELFGYSSGGRLTRIEFDAEGKDPNFAIKLEYDEFLNLRSIRKDVPGPLYWGSRKISVAGQVTHEQRGLTDPSIPTTAVFTTNTYLPDTLRLQKIETTKSGAINPLQSLAYTWTPGGDLQQRTDTAPVAPNPDQVENLGHDALHRLTSWQIAGGSTRTVTYDVLGNITSKSDTGTYTYDAQRRLDTTSVGAVSYDFLADGNLSTWGGKTLTWTPLDQVRTLTTPTGSFSYRYDAEGTRTSRSDGTNVNVRISELFERRYASNGWPTVYYRIPTGDGRIAAEVKFTPTICAGDGCSWNETTKFVHDDHLGSSSLLTNTAGSAVGGVNYDPWGRPRNRTSWKDYLPDSSTADIATGFTGHQPEMEGGLINMRGRMYDPRVGRFASVDPIVQAPLSSQGWTPYSYVFNQPLSMVDPSGYEGLGGGNNSCDNAPRGHMCTPYVVPTERPTLRPATEGQLYASMFGPGIGGFNGIGLGGGGAFGFSGISSSGVPGPTSGGNIVSPGREQDSVRPGLTGWSVGGSLGLGVADWVGDYDGPGLSARIRVPRTLRPGAKRRGVSVTKTPDGHARVYEDETVNPLVHLQKSPGIRPWGKRTGRQWGHPAVIDAIANVGRTWNKVHPNNPIRIGDISLQEGGQFEPHVSHDQGLDVDVAIMTTTPSVLKRHVGNSTYSRDLTRELIQTFLNEKTLKIAMIFFSDEVLAEEFDVIIDDGIHWSHFHIRYKQ